MLEVLCIVGVEKFFELVFKEGFVFVNGIVVGFVFVFIVCYDVNIMVLFVEVLFVFFCEVM